MSEEAGGKGEVTFADEEDVVGWGERECGAGLRMGLESGFLGFESFLGFGRHLFIRMSLRVCKFSLFDLAHCVTFRPAAL